MVREESCRVFPVDMGISHQKLVLEGVSLLKKSALS
jgi:hypothetical protein